MKSIYAVSLAIFVSLISFTMPVFSEQRSYQEEQSVIMERIQRAILARDFKELEQMAERYRKVNRRTAWGGFGLQLFYLSFDVPSRLEMKLFPQGFSTFLEQWRGAVPNSMTELVLRADRLGQEAWDAHDRGMGNSRPDLWEIWRQKSGEAWNLMKPVINSERADGGACRVIMHVAPGFNPPREEVNQVIERCAKVDVEYLPFHLTVTYYLHPKWNGKKGEISENISRMADRQSEAERDIFYAKLVNFTSDHLRDQTADYHFDAERVRRGFKQLREKYPGYPHHLALEATTIERIGL